MVRREVILTETLQGFLQFLQENAGILKLATTTSNFIYNRNVRLIIWVDRCINCIGYSRVHTL